MKLPILACTRRTFKFLTALCSSFVAGILKRKFRKRKIKKREIGRMLLIFSFLKSGRREKISQKLKKEKAGAPKIGAIPK